MKELQSGGAIAQIRIGIGSVKQKYFGRRLELERESVGVDGLAGSPLAPQRETQVCITGPGRLERARVLRDPFRVRITSHIHIDAAESGKNLSMIRYPLDELLEQCCGLLKMSAAVMEHSIVEVTAPVTRLQVNHFLVFNHRVAVVTRSFVCDGKPTMIQVV